jgi:ribonucleoside-diphosphate reductase alpha chain
MTNLPTDYQTFIHKSRYARWLEGVGRRENWDETIDRYLVHITKHLVDTCSYSVPKALQEELRSAIATQLIMPSMRAMQTAGPALDRCNVSAYNCAYIPIDNVRSFDEALYILMAGTGVGYSVEQLLTNKLPVVSSDFDESATTIIVADSKTGWAQGLRELLPLLYAGQIPKWDLSRLRPRGARLKTFGGRASGPEPLNALFRFCVETFKTSAGRKLTPLECSDIMCMIGSCVVSGGVRRSALICLSDINDFDMRYAKSGDWRLKYEHRELANISAAYDRKPDVALFFREWAALYGSKSGERGIFNRDAARRQVARNGRREVDYNWGTNPCSEIILRPYQFCNLTEVVCRSDDTLATLENKVRLASILGTFQSTLTDFKYLRKIWATNTEEERLLGVSLTGVMDCPLVNGTDDIKLEPTLTRLKDIAVDTNKEWAKKLGIPQSTAVTCNKPSGTVSQLTNSSEGVHARHSPYYIRTVRADLKDPMTQFMIDQGVPYEPEFSKPNERVVFSFPMKAPDGAITRNDRTAIQQLEHWKALQDHWCEHKPSCTVSVKEDEWPGVGAWVWDNFDNISGVSFLPYDGGSYKQAPYQDKIPNPDPMKHSLPFDKAAYDVMLAKFPKDINWDDLVDYESEDNTTGSQELACVAGVCEVVDIGGVS